MKYIKINTRFQLRTIKLNYYDSEIILLWVWFYWFMILKFSFMIKVTVDWHILMLVNDKRYFSFP
jgi:hypothetical protein